MGTDNGYCGTKQTSVNTAITGTGVSTMEEKETILKEFITKLVSNQKDLPDEFRLSNEDFWKCLY